MISRSHVQSSRNVQPTQPKVIKLSRHRHSRSLKSRHHHLSSSMSRPRTIIHATVGFNRTARSTDNKAHNRDESRKTSTSKCSRTTARSVNLTKIHRVCPSQSQTSQNQNSWSSARTENDQEHSHQTIFTATTSSTKTRILGYHEKSIGNDFQNIKTIDLKSDRTGITKDYHQYSKRNKNKKCPSLWKIVCALAGLMLGIVIIATLLALLIKPKATQTTTTITTSTVTTATSLVNPCMSGIFWNLTGVIYAGNNTQGPSLTELNFPTGIFIDTDDDLYINDASNYRILSYLPAATSGTSVAGTSSMGNALNQFSLTRFNYVDSNKNIYISDTNNHRVILWANGASTGTIVAGNGSLGSSLNQLHSPYGVWVDSSSNVYVAEYQNHRVTKWVPGATAGIMVAGGNGSGTTSNKLSSPSGLFYDESNQDLYIANSGSLTVMKWHVGDLNGTILAGVPGSAGLTSTNLNFPIALILDRWNNIYVSDRSVYSRIQLFCNGNSTGITTAGLGTTGSAIGIADGVAFDSHLNLYVSDNVGAHVIKFFKL